MELCFYIMEFWCIEIDNYFICVPRIKKFEGDYPLIYFDELRGRIHYISKIFTGPLKAQAQSIVRLWIF